MKTNAYQFFVKRAGRFWKVLGPHDYLATFRSKEKAITLAQTLARDCGRGSVWVVGTRHSFEPCVGDTRHLEAA